MQELLTKAEVFESYYRILARTLGTSFWNWLIQIQLQSQSSVLLSYVDICNLKVIYG